MEINSYIVSDKQFLINSTKYLPILLITKSLSQQVICFNPLFQGANSDLIWAPLSTVAIFSMAETTLILLHSHFSIESIANRWVFEFPSGGHYLIGRNIITSQSNKIIQLMVCGGVLTIPMNGCVWPDGRRSRKEGDRGSFDGSRKIFMLIDFVIWPHSTNNPARRWCWAETQIYVCAKQYLRNNK